MSVSGHISGSLLKTILDVAEENGASRLSLLSLIDSEDPSQKANIQIPVNRIIVLFQEILKQTGNQTIGLDIGSNIRPGSLNALGYALMSSENLSEALQLQKTFGGVISNCAALKVNLDHPSLVEVSFTIEDLDPQITRPLHELFLSMFWNFAKWITRTEGKLTRVCFTHSVNGHLDAYLKTFGLSPLFDQQECQLIFEKKYLDAPLHQSDPNLNELMREQTAALLRESKKTVDLYALVAAELQQLMPRQKATLTLVAGQLNMSERTLSRKLKEEGFTFKSVLSSVRESLAQEYLRNKSLSVNDIACKLGYQDYSSFSHAFRSWTGHSPSEYREDLGSTRQELRD